MDLPRVWGPFLRPSWRRPLLGGLVGQPMASGTGVSIGVYVLCLDPAGEDLSLSTPQAQTRWFPLLLPHLSAASASPAPRRVPSGLAKIGSTCPHTCANSFL